MSCKTSREVNEIMESLRERDGDALDSLIDRLGAYYASINNPDLCGGAEIAPSVFLREFEALLDQRQSIVESNKEETQRENAKANQADWEIKAAKEAS